MQRSADTNGREPLHDIAHLGSVELFTPTLDRSLWYFRDLLGMTVGARSRAAASTCAATATMPRAR